MQTCFCRGVLWFLESWRKEGCNQVTLKPLDKVQASRFLQIPPTIAPWTCKISATSGYSAAIRFLGPLISVLCCTRHVPRALALLTQLVRWTHQGALGHTTLVNFFSRVPSVLITPWCKLVSTGPELHSNYVRMARSLQAAKALSSAAHHISLGAAKKMGPSFSADNLTGVFRNEASAK